MKTAFFNKCRTLNEVKKEFKRLALIYHPDRPGGDTATMQEINNQYEQIMRNPFFGFQRAKEEAREDFIRFPEIINQIIRFDINIEICGNLIWLSGDTYTYREELKKIGFFFAPKKSMWYWRPRDFKSTNREAKDMDFIRSKYGSDTIQPKRDKVLKEGEAPV
jgi:hypothetical protein